MSGCKLANAGMMPGTWSGHRRSGELPCQLEPGSLNAMQLGRTQPNNSTPVSLARNRGFMQLANWLTSASPSERDSTQLVWKTFQALVYFLHPSG